MRGLMKVLSSPEFAEWEEAMPTQPWWAWAVFLTVFSSCRTCSKLGRVTRSTGHGPQRALYGTCGVKSLGAAHESEEQSAWGGYICLSPVLSCPVHSFSSRACQQWSTLQFIVTRWDMSVLQGGNVRAGHTLALTLIYLHKGEKTAEQAGGIHGELSTKGSKSVKLFLCFPASEGCLWYTRESCLCAVIAPCLLWRAELLYRAACVYAVFSFYHPVWRSWSAHTMQGHKCHSLPPTLAKGIPKPHRCTWLSWSRALVSVCSNSPELELAEFRTHPRLSGGCISERQGKLSAGVL